MNKATIFSKGILKENAVFVMLLGLCPTLGTTTSAINGMGMGLATLFVLLLSNITISLIKNIVPDMVRIPAFIVVIASLVTVLQMLMQAYTPGLYATLGLFIPLIVVNCMILGRAEAFASKNSMMDSIMDALGMGLGFTLALTILGAVREVLGSGSIFDFKFIDGDGMLVFVLAPGGFFGLGFIIAILNWIKRNKEAKAKLQAVEINTKKK
jgi:electron transport complex protein RnfE